jgi:hypothetical protein
LVSLLPASPLTVFAQNQNASPEQAAPVSSTQTTNSLQVTNNGLQPAAPIQGTGTAIEVPAADQGTAPIHITVNIAGRPVQSIPRQIDPEAAERMRQNARENAERMHAQQNVTQPLANSGAPDQSEQLKNSKDHDFILHNFRTMYVDAREARYFGSDQVIAELGKNKGFQKLDIHIVDDPRVADVVLKIGYTFAWDYPFELRHQNTTIVLLSGKGIGPFSGPAGATDVARQFVKATRSWREVKKADSK